MSSPAFAPHHRHHGAHPYDFVGDRLLGRHCDDDATPYRRQFLCCCAKHILSGGDLPSSCPPNDRSVVGGVDYDSACPHPSADVNCNPTYVDRANVFNAEPGLSAVESCCLHSGILGDAMPDACQNVDPSNFRPGGSFE